MATMTSTLNTYYSLWRLAGILSNDQTRDGNWILNRNQSGRPSQSLRLSVGQNRDRVLRPTDLCLTTTMTTGLL